MEMKRWLSLLLTVCLLLGNVPLCTLATEEPAMPETTETAAEETAEETTAETTGETVGEIMGETTQPHAHDYRRQETAPTCTEQGFVTLVCSACGDSQPETVTTDITEAFSWTDGKMILATTGECTDYSTWQASDYVNISGAETVMIKTADTIYGSTTTGLAFYDANKAYISGVTHTDGTGIPTVP